MSKKIIVSNKRLMIDRDTIIRNTQQLHEEISRAAEKSGRSADDIVVVAVTKYVDANVTRLLPECGVTNLGESRPQALWEKAEQLKDLDIQWHMIGHLQRNKVARTIDYAGMIHSIDSLRLLEEISEAAGQKQKTVNGLLQVNISDEPAKHGFTFDAVAALFEKLDQYASVNIQGLMGMAGLDIDDQQTSQQFASLRELRDKLNSQLPVDSSRKLQHLSMGMSHDFHLAIEQGATMVRIGSRFFES